MKLSKFFIIGIVCVICGCGQDSITGDVVRTPKDVISVRLPIPVLEAAQTPFYVALDNGYYAQENLDVEFELGSAELNPVKMVASGVDTFGVLGGPDTLLVARSREQPLVAVSVIHRNSDFAVLITLADSSRKTLLELNNSKVGFFYGHISTDVLRNLFNRQAIHVEEVNVGFDYSQLVANKLDAQWAFRTTAGVNLPSNGIEIHTIHPKDYGITTHGYTIFTTENTLKNKPELIARFLRATHKGIEYTLANPDIAIRSLLTRGDKLSSALEIKRLSLYNNVTSNSDQFPIGYLDKEMFEQTYSRLREEKVLVNEFDVEEAFTTQFRGVK